MSQTGDTAGVIAPPPLIALAAVLIGFALDWQSPAFLLEVVPFALRVAIGVALIAAGAALAIAGRNIFVRSGTNVNPYQPALALVTTGVFAYVRNPTYTGLGLMAGGIGIAFAADWVVVMVVPQMLLIHFGVVRREERYLTAKFGEAYRNYLAAVPRYGVPL
jgi:protein-S-isoprenylcysteine O-methyltransferase Ste14